MGQGTANQVEPKNPIAYKEKKGPKKKEEQETGKSRTNLVGKMGQNRPAWKIRKENRKMRSKGKKRSRML